MKVIIPMAGMGKRMRPHTLTTPKPLIPIAGKSIVQRLVENIIASCPEKVDEIGFVIGNFGSEVEENLIQIAADCRTKGSVFYQKEPLGIAHAVLCARDLLHGKVMIAFADTLFKADFTLDNSVDGTIWVQKVDDPTQFGVVKLDEQNIITDFVEKPSEFVSDLAIIGVYFFRDGINLMNELHKLIDRKIKDRGEFQFTSVLQNMKNSGARFNTGKVVEWLDCGNKDSTIYTNQRILENNNGKNSLSPDIIMQNAVIIPPCYVGENVRLVNSIIGPYVSIGNNSTIEETIVKNSIIQANTKISCLNINNSMLGNFVDIKDKSVELNIGDFTTQHHNG